jgi:hypothetical protein
VIDEMFTSLPRLAERLGIKEGEGEEFGKVWVNMADGRKYNMFALIHAVLDRIEESVEQRYKYGEITDAPRSTMGKDKD